MGAVCGGPKGADKAAQVDGAKPAGGRAAGQTVGFHLRRIAASVDVRHGAATGSLVKASAMTSLLSICGSLPLFLGGEVARPGRTIRRGLIGIGIALSTAGVILWEYLAVTRLVSAVSAWRTRPITLAIAAVILAAAPFSLIDPDGFYDTLLKPSLVALWVSQLIVFAVYPRFAHKHGQRMLSAWMLSIGASAFAVYGLVSTLQQASS